MTAAKPAKGIARKPMRDKIRQAKKFKPNSKYNQRRQAKAVKKLLTK